MEKIRKTLLLSCLLILLLTSGAASQYPFGKNKVIYSPKDWKVIETLHTEIYYYPDELGIAEFVAGLCEDVYREYSDFFGVEFKKSIPVILYGTHHDFKETNILPYLISESTAGFTEFIKGRVALPFTGSYGALRRVFRHEMAHAFMLEKLSRVMRGHRRFTYSHPPLWFTEGLAEFLANGELDSDAMMFMRDAVIGGLFFPLKELWRIQGTYLMYKAGESALQYIAGRFGRESIKVILDNWWKNDKFDNILLKTIGESTEDLSRSWEEYLKRRYYPAILDRRRVEEIGETVSEGKRSFEMHPVCYGNEVGSERVFCVGYGLGSIDLFEFKKNEKGLWTRKTLIRGGRSTEFESIPLMRSRISLKGDTLLFASKAGKRDAIYLYDVNSHSVLDKIVFQGVRILNSPTLSHDGRFVAFSAIDNDGKSDLFSYDIAGGVFRRLTDDFYHDVHPDWHPSKNLIVFSSDRCPRGLEEHYALYTVDHETLEISALTSGSCRDYDPRWLEDGSGILFSSDREGVFDIFLLKDREVFRQTNVLGGAFQPFPCRGGEYFVAASYSGGTYRIYKMPFKDAFRGRPMDISGGSEPEWEISSFGNADTLDGRDYRIKLGLDFIGAAFAVDPDFGNMGNGAQLFLTDILGNHQLVLLFGSASDNFDDFWRKLNFAFTYVNLQSRLNYAVGAFHLSSFIGTPYDLLRFERRYGVLGGLSYPFSKFSRVELSGIFKGMERDDDVTFLGISQGRSWLLTSYLSFTTDNIVWYIGGPLSGHRLNVSVGNSVDFEGSRYESTTLHLDLRNYINVTRRIVFAQRLVSRNAFGSDLQLFYLGGSWDLRGYRFREFAGKRILLINNEIRFPLIDRLLLKLPFGLIEFPIFRGSLFLDVGRVSGFLDDTGWIGSLGTSIEMNLGYLPVIRLNFSNQTDFKKVNRSLNVGFFLGFNF